MSRIGPASVVEPLGRDAELAALGQLLDADTPVVVVGEPGIGKTTLVRAAITASRRPGREGGGFATLSWMPLLPLELAIGQAFDTSDPEAVSMVIEDEVGDGVLFVDDAQWADALTLTVLRRLVGRVGLVVGVRLGDPGTAPALAAVGGAFRIDVDGLHPSAATALVRRARPDIQPPAMRRAVERAGGNPLLLEELALADEDDASLAAMIRRRLDGLPATAREAMILLGLARRPLAADFLGPGAGALLDAGLARLEPDGRLAVRHDLLGEAAVAGASVPEQASFHARLARAADTAGDAARHHLAAGERQLALQRASEAAAAASSPDERGAHLAIAAQAADGEAAIDLRFAAAAAMSDAAEESAALTFLRPVLATVDLSPARARILAKVHRVAGEVEAARAVVARGFEALRSDQTSSPEDEVGLALEAARNAEWELDGATTAVRLATDADALARRHGIATTEAKAVLGAARCLGGDLRGLDDLAVAVEAAFVESATTLAFATANTLAYELLKSGRASEGLKLTTELQARALELGLAGHERTMARRMVGFAWHAGRFREAVTAGESLDSRADPDDSDWYLAQALIDVGRFGEARVRVNRMVASAQPGEWSLGNALWILAELELASGRFAEAAAAADRHAREVPGAGHRLFIEVAGAWARFEMGQPPTWPSMPALRSMTEGASIELEALRALADGDPATAAPGFAKAAEAWAGRHARGELRCLWAEGESHRRRHAADVAIERLLALEERLVQLEARALQPRVHRSLRLLGLRRAARSETLARSPLTAREAEILGLVAEGIRDREIATRLGVSRWAVVRAVGSASAKLGASTRAEAVATLAR